jgi:DNA-binding NtrC family response regulator
MSSRRVLLASSGDEFAQTLARLLSQRGLETLPCFTIPELKSALASQRFDVVFCATHLQDGSFREALKALAPSHAGPPVVVFSRVGEEYMEAMRLGAFDFIAPPYRSGEVDRIVSNAIGTVFTAAASA